MEPKPQQPQQQPRLEIPKPKIPLSELGAKFLVDRDDKSLLGTARTFAGRMHQVVLHMQVLGLKVDALVDARRSDVREIKKGFEQITKEVRTLAGLDESQPASSEAASVSPEPNPPAQSELRAAGKPGWEPTSEQVPDATPSDSAPIGAAAPPRPPKAPKGARPV